ncbi:oligosaccharide flippase family protein [Pedobacter sp.]|uniref:oligosaccharide flippase family protein n=1 Tax=Pedobacter sp. TaxID=1411316 RepID=UPI003D7F625F
MSSLKKNIVFNTLLSLSQVLFPLVTFPYVSRILGPSGVGQVSFVDSLAQYFVLFSAIGIPIYAIRELSKLRNNVKESSKLFTELIVLHLLTTVFFLLIYITTIFFIKDKDIDANLYIIGGGLLLSNVFIVEWYYQSQEKFDFITKRTILLRLVFIVLMFLVVKKEDDITKYYFLFLILQLMNGGVNFYLVFQSEMKLVFRDLDLLKHIKPLLFLTACSVVGSVYVLLDNVILGLLSSSASVGYYSTAIKITKVPISLINALGIVLIPRLSESFSNNDLESIKHYIDRSIHYVLTFGIPLSIGIALTAKWTVLLVSGQEFLPSIELIQYLSPIVVLIALNFIFFYQLFTPGNKETTMLFILAICAVVSIVLNLILIPIMQHLGAAITTTLTELSLLILSLYFSNKLFKINLNFRYFIAPIVSSAIFIPIILLIERLINQKTGVKLMIAAFCCMSVYYLIQRFLFKDLIILKMESFVKGVLKISK